MFFKFFSRGTTDPDYGSSLKLRKINVDHDGSLDSMTTEAECSSNSLVELQQCQAAKKG